MKPKISENISNIKEKMAGEIPVNVLSFGCGVDSVAGYLVLQDENKIKDFDEIIWADTGSEMPETYAYFDYVTKTLGWKIKIIKSKYGKIYEYYRGRKMFPTRFRRECTSKFKIDPINKYLRTMYGKKAHFNVNIFINYTEADRRIRTSRHNYATLCYPLVDRKISRDRCKEIITEHKLLMPHKSGCYFCWAQPPKSWQKLKVKHPDLFEKSRQMESDSNMKNIRDHPLIRLKAKDMKLNPMDDFIENDDSCGCFNYNIDADDDDDWKGKPF